METINKELPIVTNWQPYNYAQPFAKIFYCNAITFINTGTQNVIINDVFILKPDQSISLSCDKNEIDTTVYKGAFPVLGGIISIWAKENKSIKIATLELEYTKDKKVIPTLRKGVREEKKPRRKSDF